MRRPRLSPTADRFLLARFLEPFFFSLAAFAAIYLLTDFFGRFDDLVQYHGFGWIGVEYFALKVPLMISQLMPVACLAAVLLAFSMLSRSGEILAFQELGISRFELALPVLIAGALISMLNFGLSETLVPVATREARYLYEIELKGHKLRALLGDHGIWLRARGGFLSVDTYDRGHQRLSGVTFFQFGHGFSLREIHQASSAVWDGNHWKFSGLHALRLSAGGTVTASNESSLTLGLRPADFAALRPDPDEFSLGELNRYIKSLRAKGLSPGGYVVQRDLKWAMPLACLIMVALGVALNLDPLPRHASLGRSFALGIAIGFGYWIILGFTSSFGRSGLMPAWAAAWLPNAIFGTLAVALFMYGEER